MKKILKSFKGEGFKAQLVRGFTGNLGVKITNMLLTLASGILLARALDPEGYGIYAFVLSIIALLGLPTQGGLPTLVMRETARYHHAAAWNKLRGLLGLANGFVVVGSILTAIFAALTAWQFWGGSETQTKTFLWALLLLPLVAFGNVRGATLQGLRKVVQGNLPEQIVRPLLMVLFLLFASFSGWQVTPQIAVQFSLLGALGAFVVGAILLMRAFPPQAKRAPPQRETKLWFKSLAPLTLFSSLNIANNQIGIVLLGVLGETDDVAFFRVAFQGAALVPFGLLVLNAVLAPHIVRLYESDEKEKLQRMLTNSARAALLMTLPLVAIYLLWGGFFVSVLFGDEYLPAAPVLVILAVGQFINVAAGSVGLVLNMLGHEKETVKASVAALFINIALATLLISHLGAMGAAIATAASIMFWNLKLILRTNLLTGLNPTALRVKDN
ncbi:flippase [Marinobacter sp.]|uniref:flippase n=1 Tax=Marinobacter sp. TaxID=50741 RepID=UPI003850BBBE